MGSRSAIRVTDGNFPMRALRDALRAVCGARVTGDERDVLRGTPVATALRDTRVARVEDSSWKAKTVGKPIAGQWL